MYSMYIMILIAAAACLPACLPIWQIIDYFAFPYASSLAHSKCSFIFIRSQAKHDIECLHVLWIWSLPNSWFTARHLLSFSSWFLFLRRRCSILCPSLLDLFLVSSPSSVQYHGIDHLYRILHAWKRKNFFMWASNSIPVVCPALFADNRAFHLSASNHQLQFFVF